MPRIGISIAVIACVLLVACGESPTSPGGSSDVVVRSLYDGFATRTGPARREVVRDAERWAELWPSLFINRDDAPPIAVDFSREMILLSSRGSGACSATRIERVSHERGALAISVVDRTHDERRCGCLAVELNPVHVVAVVRSDAQPIWDVRSIVSCNSQ